MNARQVRGTYIGIRDDLQGKSAMLRRLPQGWRVQFDDLTLKVDPEGPEPTEDAPENSLGYGWHRFLPDDFRINLVFGGDE